MNPMKVHQVPYLEHSRTTAISGASRPSCYPCEIAKLNNLKASYRPSTHTERNQIMGSGYLLGLVELGRFAIGLSQPVGQAPRGLDLFVCKAYYAKGEEIALVKWSNLVTNR